MSDKPAVAILARIASKAANDLQQSATRIISHHVWPEGTKYLVTPVDDMFMAGKHYSRTAGKYVPTAYGFSIVREGEGLDRVVQNDHSVLIGRHVVTIVCLEDGTCRAWKDNDDLSFIELSMGAMNSRLAEIIYRANEATMTIGQRIDRTIKNWRS